MQGAISEPQTRSQKGGETETKKAIKTSIIVKKDLQTYIFSTAFVSFNSDPLKLVETLFKQLHHAKQMSPDFTPDNNATGSVPRERHIVRVGMMPRPGQPGAFLFDGKNVTLFLKKWELECREFNFDDEEKCLMLPKYCTERIGEIIESGESYIGGDWKALQTELKDLFFSEDEPKHSTAALYRLIKDSPNISMNLFIP